MPIILKNRKQGQYYVEPFVGGFNVIDKVEGPRIANDNNYYLIALFKALQNGWIPPKGCSEINYKYIKFSKQYFKPHLVGYVGFNSFGGKFFAGYCRDRKGNRNHWQEHYNNVMKQVPNIKGIEIYNKDYRDLIIPDNSIIYCDPPYKDMAKYSSKFDHAIFWEWCINKHKEGHEIFISEYEAPEKFKCVWEKEVIAHLEKKAVPKERIEKLFVPI